MLDSRMQMAEVYSDFSGLNALKTQSHQDKAAALDQVAKQFEGLLLSQMLTAMRKANSVFTEDDMLNSHAGDMYQDMFDKQITLTMSAQRGIGLADVIKRQLMPQAGVGVAGVAEDATATLPGLKPIGDYPRQIAPLQAVIERNLQQVDAAIAKRQTDSMVPSVTQTRPAAIVSAVDLPPEKFESPDDFVQALLPAAQQLEAETGISARLMIAQAALETGWGKHLPKDAQGQSSFNLFGIKADARWQGPQVSITTTEYRDGVAVKEQANFRAYGSLQESLRDYVDFLQAQPRYREALSQADNPHAFANALQQAGYATDPAYGRKIQRLVEGEHISTAMAPQLPAQVPSRTPQGAYYGSNQR